MHPSDSIFGPDFRGASPALSSMASMGGQPVGFDGSQARNSQLFFPNHLHGRPSQLSTSESTGTASSQYSVPHSNSPFDNYMATTTLTSSFDSGWSNVQADSALVPIEQYRSLQARFNEMQREHGNLMKQRDLLEAKNSTLKEAYEHLVARVPTSLTEHIVLKREDYPNITYWFRHEYVAALAEGRITSVDDAPVNAQGAEQNEVDDDDDGEEPGIGVREQSSGAPKGRRGKGRASQGENVKMRYIQHENGNTIDGWRGTDIRRHARSIFVGFALEGKLFHSWIEGVDAASRTDYYRQMVARFPEVGFCELDWKSEQIASETYSQWRTHWISKNEAEKTKGKTSSKRLFEENLKDDSSHKKTRVLESTSKSVSPDSLSVLSDSVPQINIIPGTPARNEQAMGQVAAGQQFLTVNPALLTSSDTRPQYQFSINKPFAVAPSPLAPPSFSTSANPVHPAQSFSNPGQHSSGLHSLQDVNDLSQEDTQKSSKRPNKMRVNKHSITPRNLCAKEWVAQHHGTVEEFAVYFSALSTEELERFRTLSKTLSGEQTA